MTAASRGWLAGAFLGVALTAAAVQGLGAHPLHTTLTVMTHVPAERAVVLSIRVFADDFGTAVARHAGRAPAHGPPTDERTFRYLQSVVTLADRSGRGVPLQWCGLRRTGDLLWLCLKAPAPAGIAGLRMRSGLLFELFDDQVNIVQATYEGRRSSLLFTRGDREKALP